MANIIYRATDDEPVRGGSSIKGSTLTNAELDGNFKLINVQLEALEAGVADASSIDDGAIGSAKLADTAVSAGEYGAANTVLVVTVNAKGQITDVQEVPSEPDWASVQDIPAGLASIGGLTTSANNMLYLTGANTYSTTALTAFARNLLDDADAAAARATLGANNATNLDSGTLSKAIMPSGSLVNSIRSQYTTNADVSANIPLDDSLPQIGEGTEILTATITPSANTNLLRVRVSGACVHATSGTAILALFRDAGSDAIAAQAIAVTANPNSFVFEVEVTAGSTSATTFRLRAGTSSGTIRFNGSSSARQLGGAQSVSMVIEEIKA